MPPILLPAAVRQIIARLESSGHSAYAVGGCVRDSLLSRTPKDWDLCTDALPQQVLSLFAGLPPHPHRACPRHRHGAVGGVAL